MEHLQAAIAKARAERQQAPRRAADLAAPEAAQAAAPDAAADALPAVAEAWGALPASQFDPVRLRAARIVAFEGGRAASGFDVMRTRLLQQAQTNGWKRIAITSPSPACGKSTIALNLAFSLGRQDEYRVVLAEMDLRRPSLAKVLGIKGRADFSAVLRGQADFADCALRHGSGLAIAVNQGPASNPAELMHAGSVPKALGRIEATYAPDLVIFDMPPMLVSDDAMAFMGQVDAVLLIAAAETTTIKEVDTCERDLAAQTNVMGVVLNKCRYMGAENGYGYGYHAYGYYG
jgi:protein-tyrosine kinase